MMYIIDNFKNWWLDNSHNFDAVFFDIDGTLISGKYALPGAPEILSLFRNNKTPFILLTNDGNHSLLEKSKILNKRGIKIQPDEIFSCSSVIKYFAEKKGYIGDKFFVMGELGQPDFAEEAGLKVIRDPDKISECRGVIVGEGTYDWQVNISAVVNYYILNDTENIMIVPNPDSYWPSSKDGAIGIGGGGKARFIQTILKEYGMKIKPVYLGKPYKAVFQYALKHLTERFNLPEKINKNRILMLGDSLFSDIKGANKSGFASGLVLTGITKEIDALNAKSFIKPDYIFRQL